jgi:hypothetical protein
MVAQFPTSIRTFTNKVDLVDTVLADHINALQDEVRAMAISLTGNPATNILTSSFGGTFTSATTSWASVDERLNNIEAGLVGGTGAASPYVKKVGDAIQPPSGTVGLVLKTTAGTANLFEGRAFNNALGFNVDSTGLPKVGTANVLYVGSTEYATLNTTANSALEQAEAVRFDPFLLAGM